MESCRGTHRGGGAAHAVGAVGRWPAQAAPAEGEGPGAEGLTHRVLEVEILGVSGHWHPRQEGQNVIVRLQNRGVKVAVPDLGGMAEKGGPAP